MTFGVRLQEIRARIRSACERAGRSPESVELLPVSKHQPLERIMEAMALGFTRFGENYVQEGMRKAGGLPPDALVLLGPLQRNKAKAALQTFAEIQSLDRPDLAERLGTLAASLAVTRPVWIQVDLWDEATKVGGCPEADLPELLTTLRAHPSLPLKGFMALPPPGDESAFRALALLRDRWQDRLGQALKLSAGMSGDLESAILAGSDQVRIGTALFGSRGIVT